MAEQSIAADTAEPALVLLPARRDWAQALAAVAERGVAHLPLLPEASCQRLLAACGDLSYRQARPLVGAEGREVHQDFELTMQIPGDHLLRRLALQLEGAVQEAAAALDPDPLPEGIRFNDLIVQRYPAGSRGISPHRDHIRYTGLVILATLEGHARFFVCADRSGAGAVEVPCLPGGAILLAAPGFAGGRLRPFHYLTEVSRRRVSLGIRQDTRPGQPT